MGTASELSRISRFLLVGVANTCIGLGVIYVCKYVGRLGDAPANAVGYAVALGNSFVWNRRWTFAHTGAALPAAGRFLVVFGVAYAANFATVMGLVAAGINSYLAQAIGAVPYTALFYAGSRLIAFAR